MHYWTNAFSSSSPKIGNDNQKKGTNQATEMLLHLPLPCYGNNVTVNASTCVNKQASHTGKSLRILTFTSSTLMRMCQILLANLISFTTTCNLSHSKAHKQGFPCDLT